MNERLHPERQERKVTPLDLANAALRHKVVESAEFAPEFAHAGDIVERDGNKGMFVPLLYSSKKVIDGRFSSVRVPYTYRQYYSHSFYDSGTGNTISAPGWDSRLSLYSDGIAQRRHGRTFTPEELKDLPSSLPDEEALFLRPIDDYSVEEYLESLKS